MYIESQCFVVQLGTERKALSENEEKEQNHVSAKISLVERKSSASLCEAVHHFSVFCANIC